MCASCVLESSASRLPSADSHQPGVNGLEVVDRGVIRLGLERVAVKDLDVALVPAGSDRLGSVAEPDLNVCHLVRLLLHCEHNTHTICLVSTSNNVILFTCRKHTRSDLW